jgi:hypothetical protein
MLLDERSPYRELAGMSRDHIGPLTPLSFVIFSGRERNWLMHPIRLGFDSGELGVSSRPAVI